MCHFGEAFSAYCRRPDDVLRQLDAIAAAGYHGIRFWDILGFYDASRPGQSPAWTAWRGREVTPISFIAYSGTRIPPTANYYEKLESFLLALKARRLTAHHSRGDLNSIPFAQVLGHMRQVAEIQRRVGVEVIALNEACNEAWQNGVPDPSRLDEMLSFLPNEALKGTSTGVSEHPDDAMPMLTPQSDVWIVHGDRGPYKLEHIFALGYSGPGALTPKPGWQGEPTGPGAGVSVGREESVEMLCLMALQSYIGRQAWTYMSGFGVFWDGPLESQPGFYEVAGVRNLLPRETMAFPVRVHGGTRWRGTRVFEVVEVDTRCDHALASDGRFIAIASAQAPGRHRFVAEKACSCLIVNPVTGESQAKTLASGESFVVEFEHGCLILGHL